MIMGIRKNGYITKKLYDKGSDHYEATNVDNIKDKSIIYKSRIKSQKIPFPVVLDYYDESKITKYLLSQARVNDYIIDTKNEKNNKSIN